MNFDDLQSLWAGQEPVDSRIRALAENQRPLVNAFKRRQRFLAYGAFCIIFGLIFTPLLSVVNFLYRPAVGTPLYWTSAVLHLVFLVVCAVLAFRRMKRQSQLARVRISSLRQQAEVSLASLEEERRDYRWMPGVLGLAVALALLSVAVNAPFHGGSFSAVALRVCMIVGFFAMVWVVLRRHYHINVLPDYARQQEILRQLG